MKIIIDSRMRNVEKEYLAQYGELIEIPYHDICYDEVSSHPDIFFAKIDGVLFKAPNVKMNLPYGIVGNSLVEGKYPNDVRYNVCQIGNNIVHNFKYTDSKIMNYITEQKMSKINVKQGYSNCSICVTSDNSCITSDMNIYKTLRPFNIDSCLIEEENIKLLDKNGLETEMRGFIGGATAVIDNTFILFGDIDYMKNKEDLLEHLRKYSLKIKDFKGLNIYDYGGIITFDDNR